MPKLLHHLGATADELTWYGQTPDADPLATLQDGDPASLAIRYGRTWFTAHLPVDGTEFSLSPEDVMDGPHVADVLRFLAVLGTACDRPAVLTAETVTGHHELPPLITHDPATGTSRHP